MKLNVRLCIYILLSAALLALIQYYPELERRVQTLSAETGEEHSEKAETPQGTIHLSLEQIVATELNILPVTPKHMDIVTSFPARVIVNEDHHAHVIPDASGIAREVRKSLGDRVEAGELLAILDSREIADAKSSYLAALREQFLAQSTLAREEQLHRKKVSAEADYLSAKSEVEQATIEQERARQKLLALGLDSATIDALPEAEPSQLRLYPLLAPIAGVVVERHIVPGELVHAGSETFTIADLSTVWVEIGMHPKDLHRVREGQRLMIRHPFSGEQQEAKVIYISPFVSPETRTARLVAEMNNQTGAWRPGSFVQAGLVTDTNDALITVPKSALQRIEGEAVVFVQCENGLEPRKVKTGMDDGDDVEILDGLSPDDCCATHNTFVLKSEMLKGDGED